jgi:hypothetical protein
MHGWMHGWMEVKAYPTHRHKHTHTHLEAAAGVEHLQARGRGGVVAGEEDPAMVQAPFVDAPGGPRDGEVPLVEVAPARRQPHVLGAVVEAARRGGDAEGHAARHHVLELLQEPPARELKRGALAPPRASAPGGCCLGEAWEDEEKKEKDRQEQQPCEDMQRPHAESGVWGEGGCASILNNNGRKGLSKAWGAGLLRAERSETHTQKTHTLTRRHARQSTPFVSCSSFVSFLSPLLLPSVAPWSIDEDQWAVVADSLDPQPSRWGAQISPSQSIDDRCRPSCCCRRQAVDGDVYGSDLSE